MQNLFWVHFEIQAVTREISVFPGRKVKEL